MGFSGYVYVSTELLIFEIYQPLSCDILLERCTYQKNNGVRQGYYNIPGKNLRVVEL